MDTQLIALWFLNTQQAQDAHYTQDVQEKGQSMDNAVALRGTTKVGQK
jgi:hypothetical protein